MANNKKEEHSEQIINEHFTSTLHLCNGFLEPV